MAAQLSAENPRLNIWRDRIERSKKFRKKQLKDVKTYKSGTGA